MVKPVFKSFPPGDEHWSGYEENEQSRNHPPTRPQFGTSSEIIFPLFPRGLNSQNGFAMFPEGPSKVTAGIPGGF